MEAAFEENARLDKNPVPQGKPVLRVQDLMLDFSSARGLVKVLEGVTFDLYPGEILALVGETGCGKSVTAKTLLNLMPQAARNMGGHVLFDGVDLLKAPDRTLRSVRGRRISMIFQNPHGSINPVFTLGEQMERLIRMYMPGEIARLRKEKGVSEGKAVRLVAEEKLREVGLMETERLLKSYAHEVSGGMAQRYKIAQALLSAPEILIADEATSALDVTVQAHILKLLYGLCRRKGTAIVFITHDLGIAAQVCDRIAVMYSGRIVEVGETARMFSGPLHPYTIGLLGAVPQLGSEKRLVNIPGMIPDLSNPPSGCRFHPRCGRASERCRSEKPALLTLKGGHQVACHPDACGRGSES